MEKLNTTFFRKDASISLTYESSLGLALIIHSSCDWLILFSDHKGNEIVKVVK